jgi:hypothetical protein
MKDKTPIKSSQAIVESNFLQPITISSHKKLPLEEEMMRVVSREKLKQ